MPPMRSCQPPDPNTKTPLFKMPTNACDSHCHVFGPGDLFPYAPERKYTPPDAPREKLTALHKTLGIERAVIVQASCHGTDNAAMLDAIAKSDDRYRGVCNARGGFTDEQFESLHQDGIRGVRFNFVKHLGGAPDVERMMHIVARVAPLGWHVEWHFDAADIIEYDHLFDKMPLPIVLDHMGRVPVEDGLEQASFLSLLRRVEQNDNLWVKISCPERISKTGPPFEDTLPFARALVRRAPDRIIWGSDWPHPNISGVMPNDGDLVDLLPRMIDDETTLQKVLVDNPARLYGFV